MILITHDLGVVKDRTDSIVVMYGGRVMERAPTSEVFAATAHPYTEALQSAIPDMSTPRGTRLDPIPGSPPDLAQTPTGCPFAPRCLHAEDRCSSELPQLENVSGATSHAVSCFFPRSESD